MVNKIILIGNVGSDPDVRDVGTSENQVAKFSLATSESYKNKQGERVTNTEWHNIVIWGKLADIAKQYVKKGSLISIIGKQTNRSYEKDGVTKYFSEVIASELKLLGSKSDNNQSQATAPTRSQPSVDPDTGSDNLPF